jgi:hypothetical protein
VGLGQEIAGPLEIVRVAARQEHAAPPQVSDGGCELHVAPGVVAENPALPVFRATLGQVKHRARSVGRHLDVHLGEPGAGCGRRRWRRDR